MLEETSVSVVPQAHDQTQVQSDRQDGSLRVRLRNGGRDSAR
jgi:hypothetical protein